MFKFLSRKDTKPARDKLVPYGWCGDARPFQDDLAWYEQDRARIDGRSFGRRDGVPEKKRFLNRKAPAERMKLFAADEDLRALSRHPSSVFRR